MIPITTKVNQSQDNSKQNQNTLNHPNLDTHNLLSAKLPNKSITVLGFMQSAPMHDAKSVHVLNPSNQDQMTKFNQSKTGIKGLLI